MSVTPRPKPVHPPVDTFHDLARWIDRRLDGIERDLDDEETAKAFGMKLKITRAVLLDVAYAIRDAVAAEEADLALMLQVSQAEQAWKDQYPEADELELRRLAGDR